MTEISAQEQTSQNNVHPMAAGYVSPPPSPPLPIPLLSVPANKDKVATITMGRLSLFSIVLSIMLLGALTFLGGFLLGVWFSSPPPLSYDRAPVGTMAYTPAPIAQHSPSSSNGFLERELPNIISNQTGMAAESAAISVPTTSIPSFLVPLVSATKSAAGHQLGETASQQTTNVLNQASSTIKNSPPTLGAGVSYTVQLGTFASQENANALVQQLQGLNYAAQTMTGKSADGATVYYVHSGLYNNYDTALQAASQFGSKIPGALVVKVTQDNMGHP